MKKLPLLPDVSDMRPLFQFVWKISARDQLYLCLLAILVFLIDLAPLDLQRRITNAVVVEHDFATVLLLALVYVTANAMLGGLKYAMNVYRGSVTESANRSLRLSENLIRTLRAQGEGEAEVERMGTVVSIVVSEVEDIGDFVGASFSSPVLNVGILLSVFCYMLFFQPWVALLALLLSVPQVVFIPILQNSINLRAQQRIQTVRHIGADIIGEKSDAAREHTRGFSERVQRVYDLNMQIYRRKFAITLLMNLLYHLSTIGVGVVGSWLVLRGKTEVGTVVAFISGLSRMNDPWGEIVDYFRNLTNSTVKYRMIRQAFGEDAVAPQLAGPSISSQPHS